MHSFDKYVRFLTKSLLSARTAKGGTRENRSQRKLDLEPVESIGALRRGQIQPSV